MFRYRQNAGSEWMAAVVPGRLLAWHSRSSLTPDVALASLHAGGLAPVLGHFIGSGDPAAAAPFVFADWSGELAAGVNVRVFMKGDTAINFQSADGPRSLSGADKVTWLEDSVDGVTSFSLAFDSSGNESITFPIAEGAVAVSFIEVGGSKSGESSGAPSPAVTSVPDEALRIRPAVNPTGAPEGGPVPLVSAAGAAANTTGQEDVAGASNGSEVSNNGMGAKVTPIARVNVAHANAETPVEVVQGDVQAMGGQSVSASSVSGAVSGAVSVTDTGVQADRPAVEPVQHSGIDLVSNRSVQTSPSGNPLTHDELDRLRRSGMKARTSHLPSQSFTFRLGNGEPQPFEGTVLVGRSPSPGAAVGSTSPLLVAVDSAGQDISRNHVQFTDDGGKIVVTDLASRNGTTIIPPIGQPLRLEAGEPTVVAPGSVIDLGLGVTIHLERA